MQEDNNQELTGAQFQVAMEMERQFQQSPFNRIIYRDKEQVLDLYLDNRMKQYLCQYIEELLRSTVTDILRPNASERDSDFRRGMVKFGEDLLRLPQVIKNRMEAERDPQYKELIKAIAQKEPN